MMGEDEEESPSNKEELMFEPAAEMDMGKLPKGASMPVTDLYRRKHKTDSKSKALSKVPSFFYFNGLFLLTCALFRFDPFRTDNFHITNIRFIFPLHCALRFR